MSATPRQTKPAPSANGSARELPERPATEDGNEPVTLADETGGARVEFLSEDAREAFRAAEQLDAEAGLTSYEWPRPDSPDLPSFPIAALPARLAAFVVAVAEETQTPVEMVAATLLGLLSACLLGVRIRCSLWTEEIGLYVVIAMESGEHKSTVLRRLLAPIRQIERELAHETRASARKAAAEAEALKKRRKKMMDGTETAGGEVTLQDELAQIEELDRQIEELEQIVEYRLLVADATPEALSFLLSRHQRLAIVSSESAVVDNVVGRYDQKGSPNLHVVCQAFDGDETIIDRRGRDTERLERPLLALVLLVQPHVLEGIVEHPVAQSQGLVARIGLVIPESRVGSRNMTPARVPDDLMDHYTEIVNRLCVLQKLRITPAEPNNRNFRNNSLIDDLTLSLSPSAQERFTALRSELEPKRARGGRLEPIASWAARHEGRVLRVAGILHLIEREPGEQISADTLEASIRINEWLLEHSLEAQLESDPAVRRARGWLRSRLTNGDRTVSRSDIARYLCRGKKDPADELTAKLLERHFLRALDPEPREGPGAPKSTRYQINPNLSVVMDGHHE